MESINWSGNGITNCSQKGSTEVEMEQETVHRKDQLKWKWNKKLSTESNNWSGNGIQKLLLKIYNWSENGITNCPEKVSTKVEMEYQFIHRKNQLKWKLNKTKTVHRKYQLKWKRNNKLSIESINWSGNGITNCP